MGESHKCPYFSTKSLKYFALKSFVTSANGQSAFRGGRDKKEKEPGKRDKGGKMVTDQRQRPQRDQPSKSIFLRTQDMVARWL